MNTLGALLKNTGYLALAETAKPALSFLLILAISRQLGREGVGSYTIVLTFTGLFEIIATLGLGPMIVRGLAADRSRFSYFFNGAAGVVVLSYLLTLPTMLLSLYALNYHSDSARGIQLLTWTLPLAISQQYLLSLCEGLGFMGLRSLLSFADTAGRLSAGAFCLFWGYGVIEIVEGMIAVRVIGLAIALILLGRTTYLELRTDLILRSSVELAQEGLPFLLITIASTIFWAINTLILSKLSTVADVGIYSAASRITDVLKHFFSSYHIALLPLLSASFACSKERFQQDSNTSIKYLAYLTVPMAMGVSSLAQRIVWLVYGATFDEAVPVLQILAWTVCIFSISMVFARLLVASHNQHLDLYCNIGAMLLNLILGWSLINLAGPIGAALATLLSLIAFALFEYYFVARRLFKAEVILPMGQAALSSALMGFVITRLTSIPLVPVILIGASVYFAALICTGAFSLSDFQAAANRAQVAISAFHSNKRSADL